METTNINSENSNNQSFIRIIKDGNPYKLFDSNKISLYVDDVFYGNYSNKYGFDVKIPVKPGFVNVKYTIGIIYKKTLITLNVEPNKTYCYQLKFNSFKGFYLKSNNSDKPRSSSKQSSKQTINWKKLFFILLPIFLILFILFTNKQCKQPDGQGGGKYNPTHEMVDCDKCTYGHYPGKCPICYGTRLVQGAECIFCVNGDCYKCKGTRKIEKSRLNEPLPDPYALQAERESWKREHSNYSQPNPQPDNICWDCHGTGYCSNCAGRGQKQDEYDYTWMDCPICHGTGRCMTCRGKGRI